MKHLALLALVASCSTQAPAVVRGEAESTTAGTVATPSQLGIAAREVERIASRSRQATPKPATGTLTDTTCYAATGHRTASGKWPRVGMAASNRYPFGTHLRVEGIGVVTVEDRIGWGSSLDLFGPSEAYCRSFGRRHLRVEVVR